MLTFLSLDEINAMESWEDNRINEKKEILAYELTALVHGKEEADKAQATSRALFSGKGDDANMPTTEVDASILTDGKVLLSDLMMACELAASKSEIRRLVQQGGVAVNDEKATDFNMEITEDMLKDGVKIKKGKKVFHKAILK